MARLRPHRGVQGFSLLELLICVAIIGILMAMYMTTFGKVYRKAHEVTVAEGMRQGQIGQMADNANSVSVKHASREEARAAFREEIGDEKFVTRLVYAVKNEREFEAYYFTLIDPSNEAPLEYEYSMLVAEDRSGGTHHLAPLTGFEKEWSGLPVAWEYLSTYLGDMNGTGVGGDVMYGDGHVEFIHYPEEYPMLESVARLGRRFVLDTQRN